MLARNIDLGGLTMVSWPSLPTRAVVMDLLSRPMRKFPRTPHLEGSRLQVGDEDSSQIPYRDLVGKFIVVEEKLDGANTGISYSERWEQLLQSRGHYLVGGGREKHFNLFKTWADCHNEAILERLTDRYVMYGEWLGSKHTVFYDHLPHYFQEFDLYDTHMGAFLDTAARTQLLAGSPVQSVPVLYRGVAPAKFTDLMALVRRSLAKSDQWEASLRQVAERAQTDVARVVRETEASNFSEGLYIKVEAHGQVVARLKWVRADFLQTLMDGDGHWLSRTVLQNQLVPGVDIFAPRLQVSWADLAANQGVVLP